MKKYEEVLVFRTTVEEEKRVQAFDRIKDVITQGGGTISEISEWGARRLAYEIDYQKEGYYYIVSFEGTPEIVAELERRCRITDSLLRFMTTRVDA